MVRSGHGSLRWLINFKNLEAELAKWNEFSVLTISINLEYRPGKKHCNANGLLRRQCTNCNREEDNSSLNDVELDGV